MLRDVMKGLVNLLRNNILDPAGRTDPWIYPGWPRKGFKPPWISIVQMPSPEEAQTIAKAVYSLTYQIDIWVSLKDKYTIGDEIFAGSKLRDYLADKVLETIKNNKQFADNVLDTEIRNTGQDFDDLLDEHGILRKSITIEVRYWG